MRVRACAVQPVGIGLSLTDIGLSLSSALQGLGLLTTELRPVELLCISFASWAQIAHKRVISHSALKGAIGLTRA